MSDRRLAAAALCCLSCAAHPQAAVAPPMTPDEARAVRVAEALLLKNGFGVQPADPAAVELDAVERVSVEEAGIPLDQLLSLRHNTVCFPAYGISARDGSQPGWIVYFRSTRGQEEAQSGQTATSEPLGRGVEVSGDFSQVHVEHMAARLRTAEKVFHPNLNECPFASRRTRG